MTEVLYKWLLPKRTTPVQRKKWPVRKGQWTAIEKPVLCKSGWHGVELGQLMDHIPPSVGAELWEVEIRGDILRDEDKFAAPQMRLVRMVGKTDAKMLRLLACDIAKSVLSIFEEKYPNDKRPREAIRVARLYAKGEATLDELHKARDAADAAHTAAYAASADAAASAAASAAYAATAAYAAHTAYAASAAARRTARLASDRLLLKALDKREKVFHR